MLLLGLMVSACGSAVLETEESGPRSTEMRDDADDMAGLAGVDEGLNGAADGASDSEAGVLRNELVSRNVFYSQRSIADLTGRAFADSDCPAHRLNLSTFGWTKQGVAQPIGGWNLGDFTGAVTPAPLSTRQRGVNAGWYGASGVQMADKSSGCQNHTWSIPGGSGYNHALANCQLKYKWTAADNRRPWAHASSKLKMSFYAKIPRAYFEGGAVGYVYASILLQDASGKSFWIQPHLYDSRGAPTNEYVGWDAGTRSAFANTYYRYDNAGQARYCTKDPASHWTTGSLFSDWRWYGFSIDRGQLLNAVRDVNGRFGAGLSTDPGAYRLLLATVQNEIYWPKGNGHLGLGMKDLWVFEEY